MRRLDLTVGERLIVQRLRPQPSQTKLYASFVELWHEGRCVARRRADRAGEKQASEERTCTRGD